MKLSRDRKPSIIDRIIRSWAIATLMFSVVSCENGKGTKTISVEVHEGSELAFDLSPDGKTLVFDLLGQIWLLPVEGGEARPITDSVKDTAEYLFPSFAAGGRRIVFWESRPESWGLSSMDLSGEERRTLTFHDSPNDLFHSYSHENAKIAAVRGQELLLFGDDGSQPVGIQIEGLPEDGVSDPAWSSDGERIAFVNVTANTFSHRGGRLWQVGSGGGAAEPISPENQRVRAPAYSPDGRQIAYFSPTEDFALALLVQDLDGGEPRKLLENEHITPLRIRWSPSGDELFYCAEGRIWRVGVEGGVPKEVPFIARLSFQQKQANLKQVRIPNPGLGLSARGHMGLEISPDGKKIAAIALGKLWAWPIEETPGAVREVPLSATGLSWSPGSMEVVWSAGHTGSEDLYATNIDTGDTRRLTALPGTENKPSWSPDGRYVAFMHLPDRETGIPRVRRNAALRAIELDNSPVVDLSETIELKTYPGPGRVSILSPGNLLKSNSWSPDSQWLLGGDGMGHPTLISVDGGEYPIAGSRNMPVDHQAFLWETQGSLLYRANYMLWRVPFNVESGITADPEPVSEDPAIFPSLARDGSILFVSGDGWRLRRPTGEVQHLGWPLSYEIPESPDSFILRNVRLIDGTGRGLSRSSDILVAGGRIARIEPEGLIPRSQDTDEIDGEGRIVIPGLIDAHVHVWDQIILPELLYEGITSIRDMGSSLPLTKGFQESITAGVQAGPRIVMGGLQLQPSLVPSPSQGNPDGIDGYERVLSLAEAFELDFIKMYWVRNPLSGAKFVEMAHARGFPVSSHFGYPLPLVAAGIDSKEHVINLGRTVGPRFGGELYDDIVQLSKEGGVWIVPTIDMPYRYVAPYFEELAFENARSSPFLNDRLDSYLPRARAPNVRQNPSMTVPIENVTRFWEAGVPLAAGTDYPFGWIPWMLHRELERYVQAGMTPLEAIMSATRNAAGALKADKDIGTIEEGKLADLIILDANPLEDIRNTRRIWKVIKGGVEIDREALLNAISPAAQVSWH